MGKFAKYDKGATRKVKGQGTIIGGTAKDYDEALAAIRARKTHRKIKNYEKRLAKKKAEITLPKMSWD